MEVNRYQATPCDQSAAAGTPFVLSSPVAISKHLGCFASTMLGALAGVVGAFPVAALVALVYRFPVPFSGYAGGFPAMVPALLAVLFYGVAGGFLVVAILGAVAGIVANRVARATDATRTASVYLTLGFALLADLPGILVLAVLDKIIGPW